MDTLRSPNRLRWWIAAWLLLGLGAALASPLVRPRSMELVCSAASGATLVAHAKTGNAVLDTLGLDCPLCLPGSAPPPPAHRAPPALPVAMAAPEVPPSPHTPAPTAAPPPARAPPLSLPFYPS
jgi:hypothetical protein